MTYEEWYAMTRLVLDFASLSEENRERILLIIDGLKYRAAVGTEGER
jgi:hypothetical protein